jgi:predicted enzyme related to lactoylglutathione lyase
MVFEGVCIMTNNVSRLAQFYRDLFETASEGNDEHTTINIGGLGVAIWKRDLPDGMNDGKMKELRKHCYALMFSSPDLDKTYERAREVGAAIQEVPADQPWGCRAFVMNDPDGNRIDIVGKL